MLVDLCLNVLKIIITKYYFLKKKSFLKLDTQWDILCVKKFVIISLSVVIILIMYWLFITNNY